MSSRPDATPDSNDFRRIFLNDIPMIDTRAPVEFEKGAFPSSVSLPLMTDDERAKVGTCYKQQGQDEAIKLGHQLVQGDVKEQRVTAWLDFAKLNPQGYLYCWRGGLRSKICQQWMSDADCQYPRIGGGYKAMRRFLIDELERICDTRPMLLLGGKTGCNKTALIQQHSYSVDLEGLANHLGSSFGRRPTGQPTPLSFENRVAVAFLKAEHRLQTLQASTPLLVEDESRLIGRCSLPLSVWQKMNASQVVLLEVPLKERVEHTFKNYILNKQTEWQTLLGEEQGFESFADDLLQSLQRVKKRLGGVRYAQVQEQMQQAIDAHKKGDSELHRDWIESLLNDYYDPMYDYQLDKKMQRVCFRGDRQQVEEYLKQQCVAQ